MAGVRVSLYQCWCHIPLNVRPSAVVYNYVSVSKLTVRLPVIPYLRSTTCDVTGRMMHVSHDHGGVELAGSCRLESVAHLDCRRVSVQFSASWSIPSVMLNSYCVKMTDSNLIVKRSYWNVNEILFSHIPFTYFRKFFFLTYTTTALGWYP
jgi:hypothetical protein